MQKLEYSNARAMFGTWSVPRGYNQDEVRSLVSSVRESVKEGREPEA
jgi:hypothetical protein